MLKKLRLKNYKLWADTGDVEFAPITVFFGPNSSGKTSIIKFLLMLKQTVEKYQNRILDFGTGKNSLVNMGTYQDVIHNHDENLPLEFGFEWAPEKIEKWGMNMMFPIKYSKEPTISDDKNEIIKRMFFKCVLEWIKIEKEITLNRFCYKANNKQKTEVLKEDGRYSVIIEPARNLEPATSSIDRNADNTEKFYDMPQSYCSSFEDMEFFRNYVQLLERMFQSIIHIGPNRIPPERQYTWSGSKPENVGQEGEYTSQALIWATKEDNKEILDKIAHWVKKAELTDELKVHEIYKNLYQLELTAKHKKDLFINVNDTGFGFSQTLPIIVQSFYAEKGSIVAIEQPEIHMHPKVQEELADMFIDAQKSNGVQFILESHSEHLLRRLQRRMAEGEIKPEDLKVYMFSVDDDEGPAIKELVMDEYGNVIKNWPRNFFGDQVGEALKRKKAELKRKKSESSEKDN